MGDESLIALVVDDPQNAGFGPTKHTTYRIHTQLRSGGGGTATARHRYSEFISFREELLDLLPGVVVPPLPEKKVMNRFDPEFVEKRRDMLEIFLQRIVDHPLASNCERVHAFLMWPENVRTPVVARATAFRLPPLPPAAAGDPLRDANKMLADFERQLHGVRNRFKRLQARQSEDGTDLHEISSGIKEIADCPMNSVLAVALTPFSEGVQALATHTKRQAADTKQTLLAKLKLHRSLALAIIEQFNRRTKLNKEIESHNDKIKELLAQSTKLAGKPGKEKSVAELEHKASDMQQKVQDQRERYVTFSQTLVWEYERYNKTKNREILHSLQEFAITYTDFTAKQHELWGNVSTSVMQSVHKGTDPMVSVTYEQNITPAPPPNSLSAALWGQGGSTAPGGS